MEPAHRIAALFDVAQDLVENGIGTAMGGDDFELAAPGGARFGHAIEEALVGVEREFVEDDVAAFAGECVGVGAEGVNAATILEAEDVTAQTFVGIEDLFATRLTAQLPYLCPIFAIFQKQARLHF